MIGIGQQTAYDVVSIMLFTQVGLGLLIAVLAALGYRNNQSRPMLFLAVGIAFLTFVQFALSILLARFAPAHLIPVGTQTAELLGLVLILVSIVLARNQQLPSNS